jgi:spore maturation protein CgeB
LQILFFGLTLSSSWGNGHATPYRALLRALHQQGIRAVFYERDVPYYAKQRDFTACDYCDLVLYDEWTNVRQKALRQAKHSDVVITASYLPEGARISAELLGVEGPVHVFYDLDTPITLHRMQLEGVEYLRADLIPAFDLYLSFTGGRILATLAEDFGACLVRPLYGCVDPDVYGRRGVGPRFACDLSFMGTYAPDRAHIVRELFVGPAEMMPAQSFLLAGSMYPHEGNWPVNVKRIDHVAPADHPALYSSSRATLNLTRGEMARWGYCPSGRFFEAAACGTPLLTDEWEGLDRFFDPVEELVVVRTRQDVVEAVEKPDEELVRRAVRARERTLDQHTGQQRAKELLTYCDEARHCRPSMMETFS